MEFGISPPASSGQASPHRTPHNDDELSRERGFSGNGRRDGLLPGMVRPGSGTLLVGGFQDQGVERGGTLVVANSRGDVELSRNL